MLSCNQYLTSLTYDLLLLSWYTEIGEKDGMRLCEVSTCPCLILFCLDPLSCCLTVCSVLIAHLLAHVPLFFQSMGGPHSKTINMGGVQKEVVSNQFNCPLNMYSDEAIAEAAMTNKQHNIG